MALTTRAQRSAQKLRPLSGRWTHRSVRDGWTTADRLRSRIRAEQAAQAEENGAWQQMPLPGLRTYPAKTWREYVLTYQH